MAKLLFAVVALGKAVIAKDAWVGSSRPERHPSVRQCQPVASTGPKRTLFVSPAFADKHKGVAGLVTKLTALAGCRWHLAPTSGAGATQLVDMASVLAFARSATRIQREPGVGSRWMSGET